MSNIELEHSLFNLIEYIYSTSNIEKNFDLIEKSIKRSFRDYNNDNTFLFVRSCDYLGIKVKEIDASLDELKTNEVHLPVFLYSNNIKKYICINKYSKITGYFTLLIFSNTIKKVYVHKSNLNKYLDDNNKVLFIVPDIYFEKNISPIRRILSFISTSEKDILIIMLYSLIIGVISLVIPTAIQSLVNTIAFAILLQPLIILTLIVFFFLSFSGIVSVLRKYTVELIQRRLFVNISLNLSKKITKVKIEEFDKNHGPELVNRFFDILTVQKSASILLIDGLTIGIQIITGMIVLAFYHPILLAFDIIIITWILGILFLLSKNAVKTVLKESKSKYVVAAWLEELALYFKSFKNNFSKDYAFYKSNLYIRQYIEYRVKHFKVILRIVMGSIGLQVIANSALLGIGGWLVMQQQLSIGQLVASEIILTLMLDGFTKFGKQLEVFYDLIAAADKLGFLIDLETDNERGEIIEKDSEINISIHSASFAFDKEKIFENIDIDIIPKSKILVLGNTSSGKTTLIELLYGLRYFNTGYYAINDININRVDRNYLRESIFEITDIDIFEGTVEDNIRMGREYIKTQDILDLLKFFDLGKKIINNEQSLGLKLSSGGSPLSHTMRLELLLIRALISKPKVILIDCALDNFDDDILENLFYNVFKDITLIVTSSNNRLAKYCDRKFKINNYSLEEIL